MSNDEREPWESDERDYDNATSEDYAKWEQEDDDYRKFNNPYDDED